MAYTTIDNPGLFFNTVLYTGNGSTQSITGVGFQPDWVWTTSRNNGYNRGSFDSVRGPQKEITTNGTGAESTLTNGLNSFDSDGFTFNGASYNTNAYTFASWNWLAGGSASSNSDGDITSNVSANTTSGFSVVSYTGNGSTNQTIGHGLGAIPDFIIVKQRNTTRNWPTYSKALGNGVAFLDITDAWAGGSSYQNYWYISGMTSSTFGISNNDNTNASSGTFIAYCFSEKKGYSKFGSYTGNGSSDGTFVYTGFKPAFIIFKRSSGTGNWQLLDNKRLGFNDENHTIYPNSNNTEQDETDADILSNGFKLRNTGTDGNGSGSTYLYMAFAENPFVTTGTKAAGTAR
tara:strand:+ start:89 stop:1126 length:1038 start_codon:yes stop_codon:yes gene_type:complete